MMRENQTQEIRSRNVVDFYEQLDGRRELFTALLENGQLVLDEGSIERLKLKNYGLYKFECIPIEGQPIKLNHFDLGVLKELSKIPIHMFGLDNLENKKLYPEGSLGNYHAKSIKEVLVPNHLAEITDSKRVGGYKLTGKARSAEYVARIVIPS